MIDALFNQPNYLAAKKMLDVTVLRHEAIASNLANVEVPNYKRLDVSPSFESKDPSQIASIQPSLSIDTTASSGRNDGNTVQLETEMLKLNQNMVEDTLETQLVSRALLKMRMAITGKS
jgi:flagellar basal-body rod protein FlgB